MRPETGFARPSGIGDQHTTYLFEYPHRLGNSLGLRGPERWGIADRERGQVASGPGALQHLGTGTRQSLGPGNRV